MKKFCQFTKAKKSLSKFFNEKGNEISLIQDQKQDCSVEFMSIKKLLEVDKSNEILQMEEKIQQTSRELQIIQEINQQSEDITIENQKQGMIQHENIIDSIKDQENKVNDFEPVVLDDVWSRMTKKINQTFQFLFNPKLEEYSFNLLEKKFQFPNFALFSSAKKVLEQFFQGQLDFKHSQFPYETYLGLKIKNKVKKLFLFHKKITEEQRDIFLIWLLFKLRRILKESNEKIYDTINQNNHLNLSHFEPRFFKQEIEQKQNKKIILYQNFFQIIKLLPGQIIHQKGNFYQLMKTYLQKEIQIKDIKIKHFKESHLIVESKIILSYNSMQPFTVIHTKMANFIKSQVTSQSIKQFQDFQIYQRIKMDQNQLILLEKIKNFNLCCFSNSDDFFQMEIFLNYTEIVQLTKFNFGILEIDLFQKSTFFQSIIHHYIEILSSKHFSIPFIKMKKKSKILIKFELTEYTFEIGETFNIFVQILKMRFSDIQNFFQLNQLIRDQMELEKLNSINFNRFWENQKTQLNVKQIQQ